MAVTTALAGLVAVGVGAGFALERFAGTEAAWRGLGAAIEAIPAWWALAPSAFVLAAAGGFCAVRYVQAQARAVEMRADNDQHAAALPAARVNGKDAVSIAQRRAEAYRNGQGA